jgi:hypothetical protein
LGFSLIATGLIAALVFAGAPAPASSGDATAVAAKKCKRKHHKKHKCKKKQVVDPGSAYVPPKLSISPASQYFGSVMAPNYSPSFTFVVTNVGGLSSPVTLKMTGTDATAFLFVPATNTCGPQMPVGGNCHFQIEFKATGSGARSATVQATGLYGVTASAALTATSHL